VADPDLDAVDADAQAEAVARAWKDEEIARRWFGLATAPLKIPPHPGVQVGTSADRLFRA
jgi:hypothetical protein